MKSSPSEISLGFEHSYADQLGEFCISVKPAPSPLPSLLQFNSALAEELGLDPDLLPAGTVEQIFSGNQLPRDGRPIAQAYAGHQFGNLVPQLGDGRALLMGELIDRNGIRRDVALKGSGVTPFSRGGDGKAALGPVLREYLISEAMHALGIPTTRSLAAVATGEWVMRERLLKGAVLTRVAASHVRVGTFQFFALRNHVDQVRKLADYVCARHYPEIKDDGDRYLLLIRGVVQSQAELIARWMMVGFIHGVMNTDNMTVSGETIDYGPCAFMESYDPKTVFSSIDHAGRYAYVNQPTIAIWNLARFAETLLPLIDSSDEGRAVDLAMEELEKFTSHFERHWYSGVSAKLGLSGSKQDAYGCEKTRKLIDDWFDMMRAAKVDYTLAWCHLADVLDKEHSQFNALFSNQEARESWLGRWREMLAGKNASQVAVSMRSINPLYIPRNHLVEQALDAANNEGDLSEFEQLLEAVQQPFERRVQWDRYATPAPQDFTENYQTFCGT